jgi:hypothetical protein
VNKKEAIEDIVRKVGDWIKLMSLIKGRNKKFCIAFQKKKYSIYC